MRCAVIALSHVFYRCGMGAVFCGCTINGMCGFQGVIFDGCLLLVSFMYSVLLHVCEHKRQETLEEKIWV